MAHLADKTKRKFLVNYPKAPSWSVFVFYLLRGVTLLKPDRFCPQYTIDETEFYALPNTSPLYSGSEGLELISVPLFYR